jgi:AcrR family transcriptional regulator
MADPATVTDESAQQRILGAAERLFSQRGYENVSVRDIADEAGVTHPLIYYHWGSKRELLAAVVAGTQARMRAVFAGDRSASGGDPVARIRDLLGRLVGDSLVGERPYFLMVTRAFLDGMTVSDWPGGNPAAEALVALLLDSAPAADPDWEVQARTAIAVITALVTGWILLEDQLLDIAGLPPSRRETARQRVLDAVDLTLKDALEARPAPGGTPS